MALKAHIPSLIPPSSSMNKLPGGWCLLPTQRSAPHLLSQTAQHPHMPSPMCSPHQPEVEALARQPHLPPLLWETELLLPPCDPTPSSPFANNPQAFPSLPRVAGRQAAHPPHQLPPRIPMFFSRSCADKDPHHC
jgi:hypothetical protein